MKTNFKYMISIAGILVACESCSPENKAVVRTAVDIATATCVVLRGVIANGVVDAICATEEELAPLVKHIVALRSAKARAAAPSPSASASSTPIPTDACEVK